MEKLDLNKRTLKAFGIIMGTVFLVISILFFLRKNYLGALYCLITAGFFVLIGLKFPDYLKLGYKVWVGLAYILNWINTRIILIIIFYLVFTPLGLIMRLLSKDLLDRYKQDVTYWKHKERAEFNASNYERRF